MRRLIFKLPGKVELPVYFLYNVVYIFFSSGFSWSFKFLNDCSFYTCGFANINKCRHFPTFWKGWNVRIYIIDIFYRYWFQIYDFWALGQFIVKQIWKYFFFVGESQNILQFCWFPYSHLVTNGVSHKTPEMTLNRKMKTWNSAISRNLNLRFFWSIQPPLGRWSM